MRRLRVLVDNLPPESATKSAIRDGMSAEEWESLPAADVWGAWSHADLLLGAVIDRLAWINWSIQAANSAKGKAPDYPEPLPRPGVGVPPKAEVARKESGRLRQLAHLMAIRAAQGADPTREQVQAAMDELTGGAVGDG